MKPVTLAMPWAQASALYSAPRSLVLKLRLGEAPDGIPAGVDVRRGTQRSAPQFGVASVDRVLSHFSDGVRVTRVHGAAATVGVPAKAHVGFDDVEHATGLARTFRIDLTADANIAEVVDALRQAHHVERATPRYLSALPFAFTPSVIPDVDPWAARVQVGGAEAIAYEAGDPATIIAVLDTGILADHEAFAGDIRAGLDTVQIGQGHLARGVELVGDTMSIDTDPVDEVGHGTACASIIGARQGPVPGLASGCPIMPVRVLGAARYSGRKDPVGIGALDDIDAGTKRAIDLGARVLNMSFGTQIAALDSEDDIPHRDVVRYGTARGCVMVAASGNSGREEAFLPAALDGVIAVGSVGPEGRPSAFSTRGVHVALAAPGERVLSASFTGYSLVTGTSFAAPFVTAAAALLVSRANRRSQPIDGKTVRRLLVQTAAPWSTAVGLGHGAGVLDVHRALQALDEEIDRGPPADEEWPDAM